MSNDQGKPKTVWIQRHGYAIELTEDEIRRAYAQCDETPKAVGKSVYDYDRAVSQMNEDVNRTMVDLAYALRNRIPKPSGPFDAT